MASSFEVNVNVPSRRAYVASTSTERRRSPRVGGVQVGNLVRLTAAVTPTLPTLGLGRDGLARKEISTEKRPDECGNCGNDVSLSSILKVNEPTRHALIARNGPAASTPSRIEQNPHTTASTMFQISCLPDLPHLELILNFYLGACG